MPGMLDTILNLGLTDDSVGGLAERTGDERFAWDSYRRLVGMFGNVVREIPSARFEAALQQAKDDCGVELDSELDAGALATLTATYKRVYREQAGEDFPADPRIALRDAVAAVFDPGTVSVRSPTGV